MTPEELSAHIEGRSVHGLLGLEEPTASLLSYAWCFIAITHAYMYASKHGAQGCVAKTPMGWPATLLRSCLVMWHDLLHGNCILYTRSSFELYARSNDVHPVWPGWKRTTTATPVCWPWTLRLGSRHLHDRQRPALARRVLPRIIPLCCVPICCVFGAAIASAATVMVPRMQHLPSWTNHELRPTRRDRDR